MGEEGRGIVIAVRFLKTVVVRDGYEAAKSDRDSVYPTPCVTSRMIRFGGSLRRQGPWVIPSARTGQDRIPGELGEWRSAP